LKIKPAPRKWKEGGAMLALMWISVGLLFFSAAVCVAENLLLRRNAKKTLGQMRTIYSGAHEYIAADWRKFPGVDIKFYDSNTDFLRREKFAPLGDVENVTATLAFPWMRTFIRNLVSEDGVISAGMYYINPRGLTGIIWKLLLRMGAKGYIDFESEVRSVWTVKDADGRDQNEERSFFITTSNAELAGRMRQPPQFFAVYYPASTPAEILLDKHRERLENIRRGIQSHETNRLVEIKTLAESREMQNRMELAKAKFRRETGWISQEELRRIGGESLTDEADRLYEAIQAEKENRARPEDRG
jgi:hypothetical protein